MEKAKEGAPERTSVLKSTDTAKEIRRLVKRIYYGAKEARDAGKPVAWVMGETLAEDILTAMGVAGIYPENYGGLVATKRAELPYLERAEAEGYSHTVCGYARVALGFAAVRHELGIVPPDAPDGGMVDPDMLIGSSNICDPRYKWFQALGHYMKAPLHVTDILLPPVDRDLQALWHYYVSYQTDEVRELLRFVERVVGRKVDQDQLIEAVNSDTQTLRLTHEIYELRKAVPCPMPAQDWFLCGILLHFLPAEKDTVAFYTRLRDELKSRVEKGMGTIPEEKYRLLWSGLPPWHHMYIYNYFESLGATSLLNSLTMLLGTLVKALRWRRQGTTPLRS